MHCNALPHMHCMSFALYSMHCIWPVYCMIYSTHYTIIWPVHVIIYSVHMTSYAIRLHMLNAVCNCTYIWRVQWIMNMHVIIRAVHHTGSVRYNIQCVHIYGVHIRRVQYQYPLGTRDHINAWHNLLSLSNCFCIGSQFESRANCPISSGIKIHFVFVMKQ